MNRGIVRARQFIGVTDNFARVFKILASGENGMP